MGRSQTNGFVDVLTEESLALFLQKMAEFDSTFCAHMHGGDDFTIRLEVKGHRGELTYVRVYTDSIQRPSHAADRREAKMRES